MLLQQLPKRLVGGYALHAFKLSDSLGVFIPKNTSMDKIFDQRCFLLRITSRYQLKLENFQGEKNSLLIKNKKSFMSLH